MPDGIALGGRRLWAAAGALGVYAAAIALAPKPWGALAVAAPLGLVPLALWILSGARRWLMLFLFAVLLLPPLPVELGDSGPHVALVVALAGLFVGVLRLPEWRLRAEPVALALGLYLAVLLLSSCFALLYSGPAIAAATLARVLLFGVAVYVFFYAAFGPGSSAPFPARAVTALFWIGVASAAFGCIDFYFQLPAPAGFGPQFVWLSSGVYRRAQGVFYEASTLGNFCAFFLVMIAAAMLRPAGERPLPRFALAGGGIVFAAALIFSFSRASLGNVAVACTVLLWLNRRRFRMRRAAWIAGITAAAVVIAGFALPAFAELYWGRLRGTFEFVFSATDSVLSGRADTWRLLTRFLLDHPLVALFGVGYKTLPYSTVAGQPLIVDNMYLSMLAETGVAGLAALLLCNAAILHAAYRAMRQADPRISFAGTWMFSFWMGQLFQMLSGDLLTYWRVLPVYFWVLALTLRRA